MGLFDTVKAKAGELAADAERAGKVAAAQARLVTLQGDVRRAERELGQAAFALMEQGEPLHPDLEDAAVTLAEARRALAEKEREIAELRDGSAEDSSPGGGAARFATVTVPAPATESPASHTAAADPGGAHDGVTDGADADTTAEQEAPGACGVPG
jgi:hypothetical protein